ncbi:two component LuxR family transcriptional regulator [Burkholderia sp. YI23]|uniref:Two component LuxR family transcriptional regulator n=1 Tax=Caballeronia cordobensis TaxID=1353886 RepID=A0A158HL64_CABCO|nr:response regulator [Caballeronia cordobensis]AET92770.1 two component LuxR family transcriptional regulator [Burkholderia sp. YI23]SAL44996.1 two component LuxR family transcriptional regulator [Caballeronia cordobensis]
MNSVPQSTSRDTGPDEHTPVVYVVDDDESIRFTLQSLVRSVRLRVQTFDSPAEFLAFPKYDVPSCLILDVRLRGASGLAFQADVARYGVRMPILFMTAYGDIEMTVKAMKAGALDFFEKPFRDQDMLDAIADALKRDAARRASEAALALVLSSYESLNVREKDVMQRVVAGMLNKQIAYDMNLSEVTVKIYRGQVMRKMASRNLPDLVRKAEVLGIGIACVASTILPSLAPDSIGRVATALTAHQGTA